ncbi:MAG TPA: type II toxin-antitoxin system HicB family antitoxin [Pyrinomonadaceae bacterium]
MREKFTATVWQEGAWYVAQCREFEIASQGKTKDEALTNLSEAIEAHFEPPVATILPEVVTIEAEVERDVAETSSLPRN